MQISLPDCSSALAQNIITIAGPGKGDGSIGTLASLHTPRGLAVDSQNNLYIADYTNSRIRKVSATSGIITTVAGNGSFNLSGDNGPAITAAVGFPTDVDVASNGDLYIVDSYNHRIRKVNASSGVITTIAGTGTNYYADVVDATTVSLNPQSICLDRSGNLYISDTYVHKIRKVNLSTGIITTVAGNGDTAYGGDGGPATNASFSANDITSDINGNVYIADNFRIRKINAATGIITTVVGNGANTFAGDGGPATAASLHPNGIVLDAAGNMFITGDNRARKVTASTGIITTVAGDGSNSFSGDGGPATASSFYNPDGVALDNNGNLFIGDGGYERVRKVLASTGIINTIAGNGTTDYAGDGGAAPAAAFGYPRSVAVDKNGDFYIVDSNTQRVRRVDAGTGIITTIAGNGNSGYTGDGGPATSATLRNPTAVAVDTVGNIYVADQGNYRVRRVNHSSGLITTVAGNGGFTYAGDGSLATNASLTPSDVAVDRLGNLYISDAYNRRIRKVDVNTGIITTVAGNGNNGFSGDGGPATAASFASTVTNDPFNLAVDVNGNLFIADNGNYRIRKVTASTGIITTVAGTGRSLYSGDGGLATAAGIYPNDVTVDNTGNLYVADYGNFRIRTVTASTGLITTVAGNGVQGYSGDGGPATTAQFNTPWAVDVDRLGNLYIADYGNQCLREVLFSCPDIYTLKNGVWSDPTIWSCGYVPTSTDSPTLKHAVSISNNYTAKARRIKYGPGARLIIDTSGKIQLGAF